MKNVTRLIASLMCATMVIGSSGNVALAYNGQAAASYATKYYENYNSAYDSYSSDCTNFTSQCIVAGGFPTKAQKTADIKYSDLGDTRGEVDYFYHKKYTKTNFFGKTKTDFVASTTWTVAGNGTRHVAHGFYKYVTSKGLLPIEFSTSATSVNNLAAAASVGDIIQLRDCISDSPHHSYIVTSKTYDSYNKRYNIGVSAHTGNRNNSDFRKLVTSGVIQSDEQLVLLRITKADYNKLSQ